MYYVGMQPSPRADESRPCPIPPSIFTLSVPRPTSPSSPSHLLIRASRSSISDVSGPHLIGILPDSSTLIKLVRVRWAS